MYKSTLIAFGTALAIAIGALAPVTSATAAPLAAAAPAAAAQIAESGAERVHYRRHGHRHGRRYSAGYYVTKKCYVKRVKVYSRYRHRYVWSARKVCRPVRIYY